MSNLFCECSVRQANISNKFYLIHEQCLAIQEVPDDKCHMITTEPMVLLSLSLSHCGAVGDPLPCSAVQSQAMVFGRNQWFFRMLEGAHNWHWYFLVTSKHLWTVAPAWLKSVKRPTSAQVMIYSLWVWAPCGALCWQLGAWSLLQILSLSFWPSTACTLSLKNEETLKKMFICY